VIVAVIGTGRNATGGGIGTENIGRLIVVPQQVELILLLHEVDGVHGGESFLPKSSLGSACSFQHNAGHLFFLDTVEEVIISSCGVLEFLLAFRVFGLLDFLERQGRREDPHVILGVKPFLVLWL
jgi:hypothetical protein